MGWLPSKAKLTSTNLQGRREPIQTQCFPSRAMETQRARQAEGNVGLGATLSGRAGLPLSGKGQPFPLWDSGHQPGGAGSLDTGFQPQNSLLCPKELVQ